MLGGPKKEQELLYPRLIGTSEDVLRNCKVVRGSATSGTSPTESQNYLSADAIVLGEVKKTAKHLSNMPSASSFLVIATAV